VQRNPKPQKKKLLFFEKEQGGEEAGLKGMVK